MAPASRLGLAALMASCSIALLGCAGGPTDRIFRVPSSAMEPTIDCAKPAMGCLGAADDRVVVQPGKKIERGDIIVFNTPPKTAAECGASGIFVKRLIGLPGETVQKDHRGFIAIDGRRLAEPYVSRASRLGDTEHFGRTWHVPKGEYFVLGDNRWESCDSRAWGSVPAHDVIGPVVKILRGG